MAQADVIFISRIPDQSLIVPAYFPETDYVVATRGDGYAMVYFPTGWDATIQLDRIGAKSINAWWFDPHNGESKFIGKFSGAGTKAFSTPTKGRGNDWILVLDDAGRNFKSMKSYGPSGRGPECWRFLRSSCPISVSMVKWSSLSKMPKFR